MISERGKHGAFLSLHKSLLVFQSEMNEIIEAMKFIAVAAISNVEHSEHDIARVRVIQRTMSKSTFFVSCSGVAHKKKTQKK